MANIMAKKRTPLNLVNVRSWIIKTLYSITALEESNPFADALYAIIDSIRAVKTYQFS